MCDVPRIVPPRSFAAPRFLTVVDGEWKGWERVLPGEIVGSGLSGGHEKSSAPDREVGDQPRRGHEQARVRSDSPVPTIEGEG